MSPFNSNNKCRVAFYIRVSTEEQKKDGFGKDMQLAGLRQMVEYKSDVAWWYHEEAWEYVDLGFSGSDLNRPDFKRMVEDAKKGKFDVIAVWKIDRLSRNLTHLLASFEMFQEHKVSFCSHKESIDFTGPIWKLTFQIFGALAEFERETIKMRTKEGKIASARLGNYVANSPPFWYAKIKSDSRTGRGLEVVPEEAEIVKSIFTDFLNRKSLESIAKGLNALRVLKSAETLMKVRTTKWYWTTVKKILSCPAYAGSAFHRSTEENGTITMIPIPVPKIVSELTYELAQDRLKSLSEDAERGGGKVEYMLSRKVVDIATGRKFIGYSRPKGGHGYRRKAFELNGIKYPNKEIPGEPLEKHVWSMIEKAINRPKDLFEIFKRQSLDDSQYEALSLSREKLRRKLDNEESAQNTAEAEFFRGNISEERKNVIVGSMRQTQKELESQMLDLDKQMDAIVHAKNLERTLESFVKDFDATLSDLSAEQKKSLVDLLVEKVEVTLNGKQIVVNTIFRFDQSKVMGNGGVDEPKKGSPKPLSDNEEPDFDSNGATSWARTSDLFLRREAL